MSANITAEQLNQIAKDSEKRGYNRLLREDFVATDADSWEIAPVLVHEHIAGEPAPPHMRCIVKRNGGFIATLDVALEHVPGVVGWKAFAVVVVRHASERKTSDLVQVAS